MSSVETNSALFKPFLVLLAFCSVTNLVTHVVAMAVTKEIIFTYLHLWTLERALFWFLLAIRLFMHSCYDHE
jgi:dihydroxyacid dehydratase/phosphogluconate dehydratase